MMKNYKKTKLACYLGFITQAVAANFAPLLFLKFHTDYNISLGNIAMISTSFFFTQLLVDLFCAKYVDKIGYRVCIVASEVCSAAGLVGLAFLPEIIPSPFIGIIISVILYAIVSGLIEVLGSLPFQIGRSMCVFRNSSSISVDRNLSMILLSPVGIVQILNIITNCQHDLVCDKLLVHQIQNHLVRHLFDD